MKPEQRIAIKNSLSEHELNVYNTEMVKYQKSTGVAYVLWLFLGTLGIHKFYLGRAGMGVIYLLLGIVGWILVIVGLVSAAADTNGQGGGASVAGIICLCAVGIMLIIDLFTIPRQIRKAYEEAEITVLASMGK